jgi:hypothetical protein
MATTTPNFGWTVPTSTDLVKDGAVAIETLGDGIDASFVDLKGGTSGQMLTKASGTDLDFTWVTPEIGDITSVVAGTGLSGGGTSGAVTLSINTATTVDLSTAQTLTNKSLTNPVVTQTLNSQTGTTYTLVSGDANKLVELNNASSITLTLPPSVFSIGQSIDVYQRGAGQVTFAQGAGVTIRSTGATSTAPKLRVQYSAATVICIGVSEFLVVGDIA